MCTVESSRVSCSETSYADRGRRYFFLTGIDYDLMMFYIKATNYFDWFVWTCTPGAPITQNICTRSKSKFLNTKNNTTEQINIKLSNKWIFLFVSKTFFLFYKIFSWVHSGPRNAESSGWFCRRLRGNPIFLRALLFDRLASIIAVRPEQYFIILPAKCTLRPRVQFP